MKTQAIYSLVFSFWLCIPLSAEEKLISKVFLSPTYTIDRIYKSMAGPSNGQEIKLLEAQPPELLWVREFQTEIVGENGVTPMPKEFMCHINLDIDILRHKKTFNWEKNVGSRLFTLSQGQFSIKFPKGFGLPVMSDENLNLVTQVLNHNFKSGTFQVRHKVTVDFTRDKDLKAPLKPLFATSAFGMALLEGRDGYFGVDEATREQQAASCLPGLHAPNGTTSGIFTDVFRRKFSGHWVVKPGREARRTLVTKVLNIPFDTTLHYVAVHLHPFAESVELRDLTANKTVFESKARGPRTGIGLAHVDHFSSRKGIPVYKDHEYELVSVYNNTSGEEQDSMATQFLYLLDKEFRVPHPAASASDMQPKGSHRIHQEAKQVATFKPPEPSDRDTLYQTLVEQCPSGKLACYEPQLFAITARHGPRAAIEVFSLLFEKGLVRDPTDGHHVAHHIGHHTAMSFGPSAEAFALCPTSYNYGCQHGFFQHSLGMGQLTIQVAAGICRQVEANPSLSHKDKFYCYHGLGHGIMMHEDHDLLKALKACDSLETPTAQAGCWQGAFMENVGTAGKGEQGKRLFSQTDPLAPCNHLEERHRHECFINHAGWLATFYGMDIVKAAQACLKAPPNYLGTCLESIGLMTTNPEWQQHFAEDAARRTLIENAKLICKKFPRGHMHHCILAGVDNLLNFDHLNVTRASQFCQAIGGDYRANCFERIGRNLRNFSGDKSLAQKSCQALPESGKEPCERALH